MKIEIDADDVVTLDDEDVLTVFETVSNGLLDGTGRLITCCPLLRGNIGPDVLVVCEKFFSAFALTVDTIKIEFEILGAVDVRRRVAGTNGPWTTIKSGYTGAVLLDRLRDGNLIPNLKYEYQFRPAGYEVWSDSDDAWLTQTFGRDVLAGDRAENVADAFSVHAKNYLKNKTLDCDFGSAEILSGEEKRLNIPEAVFVAEIILGEENAGGVTGETVSAWNVAGLEPPGQRPKNSEYLAYTNITLDVAIDNDSHFLPDRQKQKTLENHYALFSVTCYDAV